MPRRPGLGPAFANVLTANLASSLADGIARVAPPLLALRLTDDPVLIAGITAMSLLPWLLFAIPAGILVDRLDRRVALALANGMRAVLAMLLLVLTASGGLTIAWLYLVVFAWGLGETVYDGAIRAVLPGIVARPDLSRANGRIETSEQVVQQFAAAPITSLLFGVSALIPLGAGAAAFALSVLLPRQASGRADAAAHPDADDAPHGDDALPWHRQLSSGWRFLRGHRVLMTLWLFSVATGMSFQVALGVYPIYAVDRLGLPEEFYGVLLLVTAVGGILGGSVAAALGRALGTGRTMAIVNFVANAALVLAGAVSELWMLAVASFLSGAGVTVWNVHVMSLRQSLVPRRLFGRVHGTWRTLLWGCMPIGALLGGLLGRIELTLPFLVGGGAATGLGLIFFRFLSRLPEPG